VINAQSLTHEPRPLVGAHVIGPVRARRTVVQWAGQYRDHHELANHVNPNQEAYLSVYSYPPKEYCTHFGGCPFPHFYRIFGRVLAELPSDPASAYTAGIWQTDGSGFTACSGRGTPLFHRIKYIGPRLFSRPTDLRYARWRSAAGVRS
jgi:hypothetical protein